MQVLPLPVIPSGGMILQNHAVRAANLPRGGSEEVDREPIQ